ncbi:MAG TPA: hypothetical protein VI854_04430 [Acidimicrobiia bacterium]|nr:hypothetical protein [Acidimicrobiia bacterium]
MLLVPDERFNDVFQAARLTDLRMLLSSVAGRIEVVTDSPGLQMSPREARELRERIAADRGPAPAGPTGNGSRPAAAEAPGQSEIVSLREKLAEIRESADLR